MHLSQLVSAMAITIAANFAIELLRTVRALMRPFAGVNELVFLQQKLVRKRLGTIVVVTHDPEAACRATRTLQMESGRISTKVKDNVHKAA